jgi:hypothetical protein
VLDAVNFPDVPEWLVVGCAVLVCAAIFAGRRSVSGDGNPIPNNRTVLGFEKAVD